MKKVRVTAQGTQLSQYGSLGWGLQDSVYVYIYVYMNDGKERKGSRVEGG